jgi:hypothetical protein
MDKNQLGFVINRFMIGVFVSGGILILVVVISMFQICIGASDTLLPSNIPPYSGALVVILISTIYAFIGRNTPDNTDVTYTCGAMALVMVLGMVVISAMLTSLLF